MCDLVHGTIGVDANKARDASHPLPLVGGIAARPNDQYLERLRGRELRDVAFQSLTRSQAQLLIVGGVTALEKVGSFLLSLDVRASNTSGQVVLPVSRYDIADYLAVSVETVCRSFTYLQQRGTIALAGKRTVKILNRSALEDRVAEGSLGAAI